MTEANQEQTWSQLETWLAEAGAQARARQEAPPAELDTWAVMARAALSGDKAALGPYLSQLLPAHSDTPSDAPQADLVEVAIAQFDAVICFLGASDPPSDPRLWQSLMACQNAIMAEAARLTRLLGLPPAPQLHALIEFSREIAGILDPETLVHKVVSLIYQSFGYEFVDLFLMDASGQYIVHRGACVQTCPEDAVSLSPRLLFDHESRNRARALNRDTPFACIACGKPFASTAVIHKMQDKLKDHYMFGNQRALDRLKMCDDCRVADIMQDPQAMGGQFDPLKNFRQ